jgi:hypothetical protein
MDDEFWEALADVQPFGIEVTVDEVKSWFDTVWPHYASRHYQKHDRAIASWWSRVRERDVLEAQGRLSRMNNRDQINRMEARLPSTFKSSDIPDFFDGVNKSGALQRDDQGE